MADWRVIYAGLREVFPQLDRAAVRAAAQRFLNEDDAALFLACQASEGQDEHPPRLVDSSEGQHSRTNGPVVSEETDGDQSGPTFSLERRTDALDNWNPYLEAAALAANHPTSLEVGTPAGDVEALAHGDSNSVSEGPSGVPVPGTLPEPLSDHEEEPIEESEREAESPEEEAHGDDETVAQGQTDPTLEMLVQQSVQEKENLAAELALFAQLRNAAAAQRVELDAAMERASVAGHAERQQLEDTQQAVARLSEENERRSGEVRGESAMLATEAKELQQNLALLQDERRAITTTLEHLQAGLRVKMEATEAAIALANAEGAKRRAEVQAVLEVVQAKLAAAEVEKADLDRQEAEANKLHLFIMEKGKMVDSMLAEVAMLREDLAAVERLASGSVLSDPLAPSSFLTVGQAGSALRRSSHSQGDVVSSRAADAEPLSETQAEARLGHPDFGAASASDTESLAGNSEHAEGHPQSVMPGSSNSDSEGSEHSQQATPLSLSAQTNTSMRLSQAQGGSASLQLVDGENQAEGTVSSIVASQEAFDVRSAHALHMGLYGPPSNLSSQYLGVFQQQVGPHFEHGEHEEEGWAMLESGSSSSESYH